MLISSKARENLANYLDAELFWIFHSTIGVFSLWVGAGNKNTPIRQQGRLRVIQAGNDGIIQYGHTRSNWLCRIVQDGAQVGVICQTETCNSLERSVQNQKRAVR